MRYRFLPAALAALAVGVAHATDVNVIGLFHGKAVVVINRGAPRTLAVGQPPVEGVALVSADSRQAVLEFDGTRQTLQMGQHFETATAPTGHASVTLPPDSQGHFVTQGQINGASVRFLVDTGATLVSLPASEASRLGIDVRKARRAISQTANGNVPVYRVTLDTVKVGDITLYNVDAVVHESGGLGLALLGMSFLSRTEMRADGPNLTLTKRY